MQNIYNGCESKKGCFGVPADCHKSGNCDMLMTYSKVPAGYQFEIMGSKAQPFSYVAGALSFDTSMGRDSVMACTSVNNRVDVLMAYNEGKSNEILAYDKYGISNIYTEQTDGNVYCSFLRQAATEIKNVQFDLDSDNFYLMLARGPAMATRLSIHNEKALSADSTSLDTYKPVQVSSGELLVTLHACFMIAAWICTASCGILVARYYKKTWLRYKTCGIDQWFHLHRFFMILTWCLTIAGFILIVVDLQGWTDIAVTTNPHVVFGMISVVLCFFQPFIALCRCAPTDKKRPIFNFFHWLLGNGAQLNGFAAIFFGLKLEHFPIWTWYILYAFLAFHVLMHLMLTIGQGVSYSKSRKMINVDPAEDMDGSDEPFQPEDIPVDAPGANFRKAMLAVYFIFNWLFTAVLILIVAVGAEELEEEWIPRILRAFKGMPHDPVT